MLRPMVAVEVGLSNIKSVLEAEGYRVVNLSSGTIKDANAIIISGTDDNVMDIQNIETLGPVINASGKTPEQVVDTLYDYLIPEIQDEDYYFEYTLDGETQEMSHKPEESNFVMPGQAGEKEVYDSGGDFYNSDEKFD